MVPYGFGPLAASLLVAGMGAHLHRDTTTASLRLATLTRAVARLDVCICVFSDLRLICFHHSRSEWLCSQQPCLMMAYFDAPKLFHPLFAIWIYQCALSLLTLEGMEPKISTLMKTVS